MTIADQIRKEKLHFDFNRETTKISALSSGKLKKYKYLTGEEKFLSNQKQITEKANFIYYPLGKAFEKQTKAIEDQGKNQISAIKSVENN